MDILNTGVRVACKPMKGGIHILCYNANKLAYIICDRWQRGKY